MASAQISETIRPAYIWTGSEWVQIGDGGSGTGGGGSVVGGTNIFVNYNEELNTYTVSASGDLTDINSIEYPDYIAFNNNPSLTSASPGTIFWDDGEGTLDLILNQNIDIALGQEIIIKCYNGEATTLNKGEVVMVSGAQGQRPRIIRAYNTSDEGSARTFGIVSETIASGEEGFIVSQGIVKGIDTENFEPGDPLYLSASPGLVTTVKPQAPNHYVWVGVVLNKSQSSGRIYVKPQNGYELDEIHDVRITSVEDGDIIIWNSASSLWLNEPIQNYIGSGGGAEVFYQSASPTTADIGDLWIDSDGDLSEELGLSHIHGQYLASSTASATYLRQDNAESTYLTIVNASSTYLTQSDASSTYATPADVTSAIESLIDSAPNSLDTLNELAAALNDDENFASTVTNELATKLSIVSASSTYTTQEYAEANYLKPTSASNILFTGNVTITGALDVQELNEGIARRDLISNVLTANYSDGNIFYVASAPSDNFTINLTNAPTTDNRTFSISVITPQGATGYYPNVFQIDENSQTIRWSGGSAPVPTSSSGKIDIFTFTLIRTDATWFVLGSSNLNF